MTSRSEYRLPVRRAYIIEFAEAKVVTGLNVIRWLADPGPRRALHVTLRGPYPPDEDPTTPDVLTSVNSELVDRVIDLEGVETFRNHGRRTIVLTVNDRRVQSLGDAPGSPYVPHATIYSGKDHVVAKGLASRLGRLPALPVQVAGVEPVIVGVVGDPLSERILDTSIARRAMAACRLEPAALPDAITPTRLRMIDAVIDELGRDAQP